MPNMSLTGYTFAENPSDMTVIQPDKFCSKVLTYSSVGFFSWGATIVGKQLLLKWNVMTVAQYEALRTLYEADAGVVFNPQDGSAKTYNVEIVSLNGRYYYNAAMTNTIRIEVEMILLIISEAP